MSRLHDLLRLRAQALATPAEVVDRALARCARSPRISGPLGNVGAGSGTRATTPIEPLFLDQPVAKPATPAAPPSAAPATIPSLGQAPVAPPPREGLATGSIIAGYRIEGLLGKGGMGAVYRANQLSMNREVAFKVLSTRLGTDPAFVNRFKREARAAGRLHHPNLITVHDWGEADGHVFFSMELVEGKSFKDLQKERGRLPVEEVLRTAREVLEALRYAHSKGVVHRDIKPDNIMVDPQGRVKVADLGLSRVQIEESHDTTDLFQTEAGSFMGTPHYMPPEQGRDAHAADARSDLYSLGATCFHLLAGRPPFEGSTPMAVMVAAQTQPLSWGENPPPKPVQAWIEHLMAKEPDQRPASAEAALAGLGRLMVTAPGTGHAPTPRRHRWRWWLAGLVVGVLIAAVILAVLGNVRRDHAFDEALTRARNAAAAHHFAEARDQLRVLRLTLPEGSPRAQTVDAQSASTLADWDAWAMGQQRDLATQVRADIEMRRFDEGIKLLQDVPGEERSPAVAELIDQLQTELLTAASRAPTEATPAKREQRWQELRHDLSGELSRHASFTPADQVALRGDSLVFIGRGSGRIPLAPVLEEGKGPVFLKLTWRGQTVPEARWELHLGTDTRIDMGPDGAWLTTPDGKRSVPFGVDGLVLPIHEILRKHQPPRDVTCAWNIPAGSALAFSLTRYELPLLLRRAAVGR